jgi:hypothetical protein
MAITFIKDFLYDWRGILIDMAIDQVNLIFQINLYIDFFRSLIDFDWIINHLIWIELDRIRLDHFFFKSNKYSIQYVNVYKRLLIRLEGNSYRDGNRSGQFDLSEEIGSGRSRINIYIDFFRSLIDFDWIINHLIQIELDRVRLEQFFLNQINISSNT